MFYNPFIGEIGRRNAERLASVYSAILPEEIGKLRKLETLNLNGNQLHRLPASIGQLNSLRSLGLSGNSFREFPGSLGALRHLDLLDLSKNQISTVPAEVAALQVIEINLNQNQVGDSS